MFGAGRTIRIVFGSFLIVGALAVLQFVLTQRSEFLGVSTTQLSSEVVAFYPEAAYLALAKIVGLATGMLAMLILAARSAGRTFDHSRVARVAIYCSAALSACIWFAAHVISYPALYASYLPLSAQGFIYRVSFVLNPSALLAIAAVWWGIPALDLIVKARRRWGLKRVAIATTFGAVLFITTAMIELAPAYHSDSHRPLVIIAAVDSLRVDRVLDEKIAPNMHELLYDRQAVVFGDHIVGVPRTFPSWIEILQGQYAAKTGIRHMFPGFKSRTHTFESFITKSQEIGYTTALISDYAGDIFPRFQTGFELIEAPKLDLKTVIAMNTALSFPLFLPLIANRVFNGFLPQLKEHPAYADPEHLTQVAMSYLKQASDKPKLLTLFYSTAHFPYAAPWPFFRLYTDPNYNGPFWFEKNPDLNVSETIGGQEEHVRQVRALYDGAVSSIDKSLGRLIQWLKRNGKWDETIFVLTADHGQELYENGHSHGHGEHLFGPDVVKVPLIIKLSGSGKVPDRTKVSFTTRTVDFAPTLLDLLGAPALPKTDGISLKPWIFDSTLPDPKLLAYSESGLWFARRGASFFKDMRLDYPGVAGLLDFDAGFSGELTLNPKFEQIVVSAKHRSIIFGRYKLVYLPTPVGAKFFLYDRVNDPYDSKDLRHELPAIANFLERQLLEQIDNLEGSQFSRVDDFLVPTTR